MAEPSRPVALSALALLGAALAAWSWGKWTDPLIDFGFELYVPWRLVEGEALYRDIAYRNGPLSPYWNALLFGLFGVSLRTLVIANLAVLAAISGLLFALLERALSRSAALAGVAVFLATCAFSQYGTVGNYNFVTPYQHGQTHGLLLGLALVARLLRLERTAHWLAAGALLGALGLTKAELFVPGLLCAAAAIGLARPGAARGAGALLASAAAVGAIAWLALLPGLGAGAALHGVLGNWPYLAGAILDDAFYTGTAGLDAPGHHLAALLAATAALAVAGAAIAGCERWALRRAARSPDPSDLADERRGRQLSGWARLVGAVGVGVGLGLAVDAPWAELARALPLAAAVALALWLPGMRRGEPAARAGGLLALFALGLLAKLGLHPQIQHYGFALGAPALALGVAGALAAWRTRAARALAVALCTAFAAALLGDANAIYARKHFPLASGADAILVASAETSPRGPIVERVLRGLDALMPADATLLAMPEGASLGYWLRRRNPTPYSLFLPTEQAAYGGAEAMLARMRATPPDYVALVHRGQREFGTGPFLADARNGAAFRPWLEREYRVVQRVGAEPFQGPGFGIAVLRRAQPTAAAPE